MEPEFNEGDIIIVSPHDKAMSGDYVVAKNDEEEATFKQYKRFDNTRILHPLRCTGFFCLTMKSNMFENFKHESQYLYHFTSSKIASDAILVNEKLKLGQYTVTNDPKETKNWHFHVGTKLDRNLRDIPGLDMEALSIRVGHRLKKNDEHHLFFKRSKAIRGSCKRHIQQRLL